MIRGRNAYGLASSAHENPGFLHLCQGLSPLLYIVLYLGVLQQGGSRRGDWAMKVRLSEGNPTRDKK